MSISNSLGSATNTYRYSADGRKLQVRKQQGFDITTTDYVGTRLYENGSLKRLLIDGGYIEGGNYYFYLTDHLGSTRVVAKADGTIMQTNHYYPYGLTFAEGIEDSNQRYKFNGKEFDTDLGLNYYDFGARLQDPVLGGRFGSRDPMARKYYPISPYAYCAGNPVKFVDPTGMEIWIYYRDEDENEQRLLYTANMEYKGTNSFVATSVNYLNNIYSNGGNRAVNTLIESGNQFNVTDEMSSVEGTLAFKENRNGGGTFKLGAIMTNGFEKSQGIESVAHEVFHGVQHELGQGGTSIFNEVEAYAFGVTVTNNWMNSPTSDFLGGPQSLAGNGLVNLAGAAYEQAFNSLTSGFSTNTFGAAVNNFKQGAFKNASGLYNNYPIRRANQTKSLLQQFYPR